MMPYLPTLPRVLRPIAAKMRGAIGKFPRIASSRERSGARLYKALIVKCRPGGDETA
jgi:hypothetical protein